MVQFKKGKLPKEPEKRLRYLYRMQELLRLFHNKKGSDVRDGKFDIDQFRKFQQGWFAERNHLVCGEINECKKNLTDEERAELLEQNEEDPVLIGTVKNKEIYKKDTTIRISINDIEE